MTETWREEVLAQLDRAFDAFMFPGLPNEYYAFARMRLTAFRSAKEWLLVFETICWARREAELQNAVHAFGNRLAQPGLQAAPAVVTAPKGASLVDEQGRFQLDPKAFEVVIRGKSRRFKPTAADLKAARLRGPMEPAAKILRLLAHQRPSELFFGDEDLLGLCKRKRARLPRFLQLEDWHIPDALEDERPSTLPGFQSLAEALETGDPERYACSPRTFNTHWSKWDD